MLALWAFFKWLVTPQTGRIISLTGSSTPDQSLVGSSTPSQSLTGSEV